MKINRQQLEIRKKEIEIVMNEIDFWDNPARAQKIFKELDNINDALSGVLPLDRNSCILNFYAGVGGDDSEDFVSILFKMYVAYSLKNGFRISTVDENENSLGGYRSLSIEISGDFAYQKLKHESGVHRLIRISPFNTQGKRQTSFVMIDCIPVIEDGEFIVDERDLTIEFTKSSGPGGQNVNKRETAVRIKHVPTGLTVTAMRERTQEANRRLATSILSAKLETIFKDSERDERGQYKISGKIENDWGSQIRTYTLHPYQLVKDHRSGIEIRNTDKVLHNGEIGEIIESLSKI